MRSCADEYAHLREAFRYVTLGLMAWTDPPELTPREYRRLELLPLDARTQAQKDSESQTR